MTGRSGSDEHYVLDLCDEVLGQHGQRQATFDWLRGDPSTARPRGTKLPVDSFWPAFALVVEFQEEQHSQPSSLFDRRPTISGVDRGQQRRRYDELKQLLVPQRGIRLVLIEKSAFVVKSRRIDRDVARDRARSATCWGILRLDGTDPRKRTSSCSGDRALNTHAALGDSFALARPPTCC